MRIPIYSGHLFRQITGRLNTAVLVRPVDLWTRRYRYDLAWLLTMVALPTSPQAQHQSKWPDLNRNRWPVLSESAPAMVAFLADAYPETGLAPPPGASRERADYLQMIQFGSTSMDMMLSQVRIHEHMLPQSERDPRMAARYRKKFLEEVEPQLARRVEATPYVCGDTFTAADCIIGYNVFWARGYGLCQDEAFRRYLKSLRMRPALAAALADAREFSPVVPDGAPIMSKFTG